MDGVKVTIKEKEVSTKTEYPCFKICSDELIVLFDGHKRGFVVYAGDDRWHVGDFADSWCEDEFKPFHGTINIEVD